MSFPGLQGYQWKALDACFSMMYLAPEIGSDLAKYINTFARPRKLVYIYKNSVGFYKLLGKLHHSKNE